jgi:hypothetical protein
MDAIATRTQPTDPYLGIFHQSTEHVNNHLAWRIFRYTMIG